MNAKIATIHSRLVGEPARNNAICRYWMMGKCNINPAVSGIALPSRWDKLFSVKPPGYLHGTLRQLLKLILNGPVGQVYAMAVAYVVDMLFAGAQDGAILAWKESTENPKPFELVSSLKGHTTAVICLTIEKNRLCSGSMDNTIRVWDLNTLLFIHTLSGHNDAVTSLICWDQSLLTCSLQDNKSGAIALCGMHNAKTNPILFCYCNDNTIYMYNLSSFKETGRIFSKSKVRTIQTGLEGLFLTGDARGMLTVWKLAESRERLMEVA
ncbi:hypothetical protein GH714_012711 [Hevea brasiliensis]|uniref:Uncharacterized protein n=1 Tax=Hevea brasiliensis TaxID=3981 RepID=A0A6A6KR20_HEVBR|nr:hypothetical protein GH714_012711 [Hevea brasiliensis]